MAAKANESKAGLIIPLVLFVLLSIILGVTTYTGYQAADVAEKKAKESDTKKTEMEKASEWYRFQAMTLRSYMGYLPKDEKTGDLDKGAIETLTELRSRWGDGGGALPNEKDPQKNSNVNLLKDLDTKLRWDPNLKRPVTTQLDQLTQLQKELKEAKDSASSEKGRADELQMTVEKKDRNFKKADADYRESLGQLQKASADSRAQFLAEVNKAREDYTKENTDKNALKTSHDAEIRSLKLVVESAIKVVTAMRKSSSEQMFQVRQDLGTDLKKLESELEKHAAVKLPSLQDRVAKVDRLKDVEPKGTVYRMDKTGEMPYLDLGTAQGLKAGQTFSIHGKGTDGRPLREAKGSLEVVKILGERLSQARVTTLTDAGREPVMPGDFVVNPAWSPNQKMHVAIAGVVDLAGDGRDNREEFIRTLRAQNVEVDAYLDLKDLKVMGQMTGRTDYLIVGFTPEVGGYTQSKEGGDAKADRSDKVKEAMSKIQDQATRDGVQIIRLKDFLAMTGYRAPRTLGTEPTGAASRPGASGLRGATERRDVPKLGDR